ncbi:hypothetical protein Taro_048109 [Colocasia esculenta]|uniref:5-formyltetrahydrofolate cyclo-ligase n=1 Tax=Colocasia esculenta TaxID=4460 RepID=A0A843WX96_COLES|nr:hypothetical protein [Colocasia esculenta]
MRKTLQENTWFQVQILRSRHSHMRKATGFDSPLVDFKRVVCAGRSRREGGKERLGVDDLLLPSHQELLHTTPIMSHTHYVGWFQPSVNISSVTQDVGIPVTRGPEIRTGFLKDGKPVQLKEGQEITISTDYSLKGDENLITMSYKKLPVDLKPGNTKLPVDLKPGNTILCVDGTITLTVLSCDPASGTVRCRYYDTFLRKYQERATEKKWKQPLLVALAYYTQIMDSGVVPVTPHDVFVNALVSPSGVVPMSTAALERM